MGYDFDQVIERRGTNCVKYDRAKISNPLLPDSNLPMWIADMDFACPPAVVAAIQKRAEHPIYGYSAITDAGYFETVAGWMRRRHNWDANPSWMLFSPGVVDAVDVAVARLTKPGDSVLLQTPAYNPFNAGILKFGRTPVYNRLVESNGYYTIDFDDFGQQAKRPEVKLFFLCSPHNPTGRVWSEEELRRMTDICLNNGVFVVCDEIHADITRAGKTHLALGRLYGDERRIIYCTAPSKTFNLAGLQVSNILIPDPDIRADWAGAFSWPNPLSIEAGRAAYGCDDWCDQMNAYLDANFAFMREFFAERLPAAKMQTPEGTYLAWVDLRGFGLSDEALKQAVSAAGLYIQFSGDFVGNATGFARMNLACPRATLERGLGLLLNALGK